MTITQTALQTEEKPKPSAAFEAAAKKLSSGKSSAELFADTRAEEVKKFEEEEKKNALKAIGKEGTVCTADFEKAPPLLSLQKRVLREHKYAGSNWEFFEHVRKR